MKDEALLNMLNSCILGLAWCFIHSTIVWNIRHFKRV